MNRRPKLTERSSQSGVALRDERSSADSAVLGILIRQARRSVHRTQLSLSFDLHVDNSLISRWESGNQVPTLDQLRTLARALQVSQDTLQRWEFARSRALLDRDEGESELYLRPDELLDVSNGNLLAVRELRVHGAPRLAASQAQKYAHWLRTFIARSRRHTVQDELLGILAGLLTEQYKSYMDYLLPWEMSEHAAPLLREQQDLLGRSSDPRIQASMRLLNAICIESTLYFNGDFIGAQQTCIAIRDDVHLLDPHWQVEVQRAFAINAGLLEDRMTVETAGRAADRSLESIASNDPMTAAFLLEGIARGQLLMHDGRALTTLDRAGELLHEEQGSLSPLRTVQVLRSRLRAMQVLGETSLSNFDAVAAHAIAIADTLGLTRYREEAQQILKAVHHDIPAA